MGADGDYWLVGSLEEQPKKTTLKNWWSIIWIWPRGGKNSLWMSPLEMGEFTGAILRGRKKVRI